MRKENLLKSRSYAYNKYGLMIISIKGLKENLIFYRSINIHLCIPRVTASKRLLQDYIPFFLPLGKITRFTFTRINASARRVRNVRLFSRIHDPHSQPVTRVIRKRCCYTRSVNREEEREKGEKKR